jgi:hypothetical protein
MVAVLACWLTKTFVLTAFGHGFAKIGIKEPKYLGEA